MIELYEYHKERPQICICKSVCRPERHLCLLLRKKRILCPSKRNVLRFAFINILEKSLKSVVTHVFLLAKKEQYGSHLISDDK